MYSRNLILLTIAQALSMASVSAVVLVGGIVGAQMAPSTTLATLPISLMIVGTALATFPAAMLMRRIGRRKGFIISTVVALLAALLAAYAIIRGDFALFCLAVLLIGSNSAFVQQYRFAATESVAPAYTARAVSFILVGGIVAGFLGPEMAKRTKDLLPAAEFSGSFASLTIFYALVLAMLFFMKETAISQDKEKGAERPLKEIMVKPAFLAAVYSGTTAYAVMSFIMTATPVSMHQMHGFNLDQTALVIQSHIIAMYLPSLFTGRLIERLGHIKVMLAGLGCLFACVALGVSSRELLQFWGALVLLGIGWNFLYVGATVLLTGVYRSSERFKTQAANDFTVLVLQAFASLMAGSVLFLTSWDVLNLLTLPFLALNVVVLVMLRRRELAPAAE